MPLWQILGHPDCRRAPSSGIGKRIYFVMSMPNGLSTRFELFRIVLAATSRCAEQIEPVHMEHAHAAFWPLIFSIEACSRQAHTEECTD